MTLFNSLCQSLIDTWLQSDDTLPAERLYADAESKLSIKMALSIVTMEADDPYAWRFRRIKDFGYKSHQLDWMKLEFPDSSLQRLDRAFVDDAIIPAYTRAREVGRPTVDFVRTKLLGVRLGYERLILPQKCDGAPAWCLSLIEGRFFIPPAQQAKTDITDDNIIQLLIEGQTTKEIAGLLSLSPRTIEHRIDKLKDRFDANNLVHLVAKLVAIQVGAKTPMHPLAG